MNDLKNEKNAHFYNALVVHNVRLAPKEVHIGLDDIDLLSGQVFVCRSMQDHDRKMMHQLVGKHSHFLIIT